MKDTKDGTNDDRDVEALAEDLVRFFHALPDEARRQYEALAEIDRRFGEDAAAERREGRAR